MKRMILIRAALFAVFAFMGTLSLSAQTWLPPAQAALVITAELDNLTPVLDPQAVATTFGGKKAIYEQYAKVGCTDCLNNNAKKTFLSMVAVKLKEGVDTGTAVAEVRSFLIDQSGGNTTLLNAVQQAYDHAKALLQ